MKPHVLSSAWYGHSDMVLQTMLTSSEKTERSFAITKILDIRDGQHQGDAGVTTKEKRSLNVEAFTLAELISWKDAHEPILNCSIPSNELNRFVEAPLEVPPFPVHGQSIERCVKEVTDAAMQVYGFDRQMATLEHPRHAAKSCPSS